nr:hypothetical protein [uncultured Carboxylicivirga sp.]
MEKLYLSKIEWLTEWFMQLFFDPMYFLQPEVVNSSNSSINQKMDPLNSIQNKVLLVEKQVGRFQKLWNVNNPVEMINSFLIRTSIRIKEFASEGRKLFTKALIKAKSTLNKIQSAFDIIWYGLSFQ